jgi:hypothetical protein
MAKAGDIYTGFKERFPVGTEGALQVWWIPQIPGAAFHWPVADLAQAATLLDALAAYDDFQFWQRVKGDYANMGGLLIYRNGGWEDWETDEGDDFDTFRAEEPARAQQSGA